MTPEKRVQNKIIEYLKELQQKGKKVDFERRQAGGYSYRKGKPDLYAVINGIHVEIEVKAPNGHLTPLQERFAEKCEKLDIPYICTDSISNFIEFINQF